MTSHDVTFYVQIEPEWERYYGGTMQLKGAKAVRVTQKQPDPPRDGALVVKLTVRVPTDRLLPLAPDPVELPNLPADVAVIEAETEAS